MFIVDQRRKSVINMDNVVDVYQVYEKIFCGTTANQEQIIAKYESEERAAEVFAEMLKTMFLPLKMELKFTDVETMKRWRNGVLHADVENADANDLNFGVYYMPEV